MSFDPPYSPVTFRTLSVASRGRLADAANNCVGELASWIETTWPGTDIISSFGTPNEANLRPPAAAAFGFAVLLATGLHNSAGTGRSDAALRALAIRVVHSFALTHAANGGTWGGEPATGDIVNDSGTYQWQGALWVAYTAHAALLLWDDLSSGQRDAITAMVIMEADRFNSYPVPYMRDPSGRVARIGDTKGEENAWQAYICHIAAGMLPTHVRAATWLSKANELVLSASATPAFPTSKRPFNGMSGWSLRAGSNIELNGALENHNIFSPNYSAALAQSWIDGLTFAWLRGGIVPAAALANHQLVYGAMSTVQYKVPPFQSPGGTPYTAGSAAIYYPGGAEGDANRMAGYVAFDSIAHVVSADAGLATSAESWLALHAQAQLDMQAASPTARRSHWDLANVAGALFTDWAAARVALRSSNGSGAELLH